MIAISRRTDDQPAEAGIVCCTPVLEGVSGGRVKICRLRIPTGEEWQPELFEGPETTQMILFLSGKGYVCTDSRAFEIREPALFVPYFDREKVMVRAVGEPISAVQIISRMNEEDQNWLRKSHMVFPNFRPFSQAWEHTMNTISSPEANLRGFMLIENRKLGANNMGIFRSASRGASASKEDTLPCYDHYVIALDGAEFTLRAGEDTVNLETGTISLIPAGTPFSFFCGPEGRIFHVWYSLNRAYD